MFRYKIKITDNEKLSIRKAVEELETESSGELVLYLSKQSDDYSDAIWYLSSLMGFSASLLSFLLSYFWMMPSNYTVFEISGFICLFMILGAVFPLIFPRLRVILMNNSSVEQRVLTKAHDVFLNQQIFKTIDRTGILIFISGLEHKVVVLGDEGINKKVNQDDWEKVISEIVTSIKKKNTAKGIVSAINICKGLLLSNGFIVRENDINELHDGLIIED